MGARISRGVEVVLVGAGPGDPSLFTLAGADALERADIVVYDYLANTALLSHAREAAELIYVGKKGFSTHVTQEEINDLLVRKTAELEGRGGGVLVRLKGGDPFVFGRGGEEALALREAGIVCSVIPGVTSGIAAPAYAGVPVTHRGVASSVAFITGNEDSAKSETSIDWDGIARGADTLCFYMGVRNLPVIADRLMEAGRSADTPVALVRWGTMPNQEVLTGTLETIAERAIAAGFKAPAIIVVGAVAALHQQLTWYEPGPLAGMTVAVTRTRSQASGLTARLRTLGASVLELPTIDIAPPPSYATIDECIMHLADYRFIVFTSANGVKAFFERLSRAGLDSRALSCARVAAIGPATDAQLRDYGIVADFVPSEYRAEAVAQLLIEGGLSTGDGVLVPRALEAREVLPQMLRARGARVDVAPVYQTLPPPLAWVELTLERLSAGEVDAVTFTSSSTVRNFIDLVRNSNRDQGTLLENVDFYSIGPITSATAREEGLSIAAEAEEYTIAGLVEALVKHRAVDAEGK